METGWAIGYTVGIVVVLVVVALVVPILLLAHKIGKQAAAIDESLKQSVQNTAGLAGLRTTIEQCRDHRRGPEPRPDQAGWLR